MDIGKVGIFVPYIGKAKSTPPHLFRFKIIDGQLIVAMGTDSAMYIYRFEKLYTYHIAGINKTHNLQKYFNSVRSKTELLTYKDTKQPVRFDFELINSLEGFVKAGEIDESSFEKFDSNLLESSLRELRRKM